MKTLCIYHANCADGFGAAWVVRQALGADNVEFHAGHYGTPAPDVEGRDVIIVDFSYPYELLVLLGHQARSILVIDHHKTAAEALARLQAAPATYSEWLTSEQRFGTVFDMERSGAGLTWDYLTGNQPRPPLINHIEDRDLWRFKLEGTREIQANLFSYPYDFDVWDALMEQHVSVSIAAGTAIERKHHKDVAELVAGSKRRMIIAGHDVPVANLPYIHSSDAGHLMAQGEPFAACYQDTTEHRYFSLRSSAEGLDVGEIAKQYGGGGHRNAAGFKVPFEHELVTGHIHAHMQSINPQDIVLTPAAQDILAQCIAAHGFVVAALTNGRPDLALAEARNWVESFTEAAHHLTAPPLPMPVTRDDLGHWTHPAWPQHGDEDAIPKSWFAQQGLEVFCVDFETDASEELNNAYFEQGNPDCCAWQPSTPPGDGWFIFSIHDTEDGPVCIWVRPTQIAVEGAAV